MALSRKELVRCLDRRVALSTASPTRHRVAHRIEADETYKLLSKQPDPVKTFESVYRTLSRNINTLCMECGQSSQNAKLSTCSRCASRRIFLIPEKFRPWHVIRPQGDLFGYGAYKFTCSGACGQKLVWGVFGCLCAFYANYSAAYNVTLLPKHDGRHNCLAYCRMCCDEILNGTASPAPKKKAPLPKPTPGARRNMQGGWDVGRTIVRTIRTNIDPPATWEEEFAGVNFLHQVPEPEGHGPEPEQEPEVQTDDDLLDPIDFRQREEQLRAQNEEFLRRFNEAVNHANQNTVRRRR